MSAITTLNEQRPTSAASVTGTAREYLSFKLGHEEYGIDILKVQEIRGYEQPTRIANAPHFIKGVVNLRGVIVPIVDLRCRFGQGVTEATPLHVVIIVQIDQQLVGLLADRVLDIVSFEASKVQPVPRTATNAEVEFLSGLVTVDNAMIALIDLGNLFTSKIDVAAAVAALEEMLPPEATSRIPAPTVVAPV